MRTPGLLLLLSTTACVPLISEDTDTKDDAGAAPEASEVEVSEAPASTDSGTQAESDTDSESGPDTEPDPDVDLSPSPSPSRPQRFCRASTGSRRMRWWKTRVAGGR